MTRPIPLRSFSAPFAFATPLAFATALALAVCAPAAAQQVELPAPVGYVNDFANVIPDNVEASITNVVDEVRAKSGGEIVVVTLPTLPEGRSRDEIALEIGRQWRIGKAGEAGDQTRNTGTVVLVVPKETSEDGDGHLKIELGDRTNTFITATEAGRIRDRLMVPAFEQGDYGGGILVGVVALADKYAEEFGFELTGDYPREQLQPTGDGGGGFPLGRIIFFIILFLFLSRMFRGGGGGGGGRGLRGGRRGRGMPVILPIPLPMGGRRGGFGGFGGGFGGFGGGGGFGGFGGGGGFSGGGAGGSW